jgi:hypothetical protein
VTLVGDWRRLERSLPAGWDEARVELRLAEGQPDERAAAVLGPAQPIRSGPGALRLTIAGAGRGPSSELVGRLFAKLDREKVRGTLELVSSTESPAPPPADVAVERATLVEAWETALATVPGDWSDLLAEVELLSSDYLERAAVLLAPLNPRRDGDRLALQFRCAARFGYGVPAGLARRCVERCDAERIKGTVRILLALSDSRPVQTQGPVWQLSGRTV